MARRVRNYPVPRDKKQDGIAPGQKTVPAMQRFISALYIRLSKEDSGKNNQNTVENQIALLKDFVKGRPDMEVYDIYIDDRDIIGLNQHSDIRQWDNYAFESLLLMLIIANGQKAILYYIN